MSSRPLLHRMAALLLLALLAVPLGRAPAGAAPATPAEPPALNPVTQLAPTRESEPNDTISANPNEDQADPLGDLELQSWSQQAIGVVSGSADVDYYRFVVSRPASQVRITLDDLGADYDLVFGGGAGSAEQAEPGLEGVTEVGAQISSIGAQISSIGAQISSIGAQISSIGAQISSIGAQISSISANPGTAPEEIKTILWLPGVYYVAVTPSNGEFSDRPYTLEVTLEGSALTQAPPAPDVEVRLSRPSYAAPDDITTLYIVNRAAMTVADRTSANAIMTDLDVLARAGPNPAANLTPSGGNPGIREYGVVLDISQLGPINIGDPTIAEIYADWQNNAGNPFYANRVARLIDKVIESAISGQPSGPSPQLRLGSITNTPTPLPNIKYVVLVASDTFIPSFRIPDLTTIANEADYLTYLDSLESGGIVDPSKPLGAALRSRMFLSDDPYGSGRPFRFPGSPLFIPRLAVGRLLETPADVAAYLRWYVSGLSQTNIPGGNLSIDYSGERNEGAEVFVSGYDFLIDQAEEVSKTLASAGFSGSPGGFDSPGAVRPLINNDWDRAALQSAWLSDTIDSEFSDVNPNSPFSQFSTELSSVNAHFDHWQLLPAKGSPNNFPAQRLLDPQYDPQATLEQPGGYFGRTLGYSVGCHSSLSVTQGDLIAGLTSARLYGADFSQAFNRHAGNWIGNNGYAYGTLDGVDYTERLSVLLTEELLRDVRDPISPTLYIGQAIGDALLNAKQRYLRNASTLTAYDAKSVQIMSLRGLPFIRFYAFADLALPAPPEDGGGSGDPPAERPAPVPTPLNGEGRLERIITVTLSIDDTDFKTVSRTGSSVLELDEEDFSVADSFVQAGFAGPELRVFENNQVGIPTLPRFAYDISARNKEDSARLVVRDVQFLGGIYGEETSFNPQITQVVSETDDPLISTPVEPSFAAGAGVWYPDKFFGHSSIGEGEQQRDQLVAAAAQFKADANGLTGQLRPYRQMVFKVIYTDPTADGAAQSLRDQEGPLIESVRIDPLTSTGRQAGGARIVVIADDGGSADGLEVRAVYAQGETWQELEFTRPNPAQAPRRWVATVQQLPGSVRVIVSASDAAGNTSYYTAKGSFQPPPSNSLFLPTLFR